MRQTLTGDIYLPPADELGLGRLEAALAKARGALAVEGRIRDALREGLLEPASGEELAASALANGLITDEEYEQLDEADEARAEAIQVDAFEPKEFGTLWR